MKKTDVKKSEESTDVVLVDPAVNEVKGALTRLFFALQGATQDANSALLILNTISEGIEADPEMARKTFTPENIDNAMKIGMKLKNGTFKSSDIERAFPEAISNIPMPIWAMIKGLL